MGRIAFAMSTISRYHGRLHYKTAEKFEEAVEILDKGGWLDDDMTGPLQYSEPLNAGVDVDEESQMIVFWEGSYQALRRVEDDLVELAERGYMVGTSVSPEWIGWVIEPDGYQEVGLEEWVRENRYDVPSFANRDPKCEWQTRIEKSFHAYH